MTISDILSIQSTLSWSATDKVAAKKVADAMAKISTKEIEDIARTALLIKAVGGGMG